RSPGRTTTAAWRRGCGRSASSTAIPSTAPSSSAAPASGCCRASRASRASGREPTPLRRHLGSASSPGREGLVAQLAQQYEIASGHRAEATDAGAFRGAAGGSTYTPRAPSSMLGSLRIRNFRVFDAIDIERLARINLVVGKNNVGKTCLLEALRLYGDGASEECIRRVLRGRGEHRPGRLAETETGAEDRPQVDPVGRLFHGYRLPSDGTAIEIGPREGVSP